MYKATQSKNVYKTGKSYRTRVMKNGTRISKNFTSYRAAVQFRNQVNESN